MNRGLFSFALRLNGMRLPPKNSGEPCRRTLSILRNAEPFSQLRQKSRLADPNTFRCLLFLHLQNQPVPSLFEFGRSFPESKFKARLALLIHDEIRGERPAAFRDELIQQIGSSDSQQFSYLLPIDGLLQNDFAGAELARASRWLEIFRRDNAFRFRTLGRRILDTCPAVPDP
jgi:hypothetical protein